MAFGIERRGTTSRGEDVVLGPIEPGVLEGLTPDDFPAKAGEKLSESFKQYMQDLLDQESREEIIRNTQNSTTEVVFGIYHKMGGDALRFAAVSMLWNFNRELLETDPPSFADRSSAMGRMAIRLSEVPPFRHLSPHLQSLHEEQAKAAEAAAWGRVALLPAFQSRGIGSAANRIRTEYAFDGTDGLHLGKIHSRVRADNPDSIQVLINNGYVEISSFVEDGVKKIDYTLYNPNLHIERPDCLPSMTHEEYATHRLERLGRWLRVPIVDQA